MNRGSFHFSYWRIKSNPKVKNLSDVFYFYFLDNNSQWDFRKHNNFRKEV